MKKYYFIISIFSLLINLSCSENPKYGKPNVNPDLIQEDFMKWWTYHSNHIKLFKDFVPLDNAANIVDKNTFLRKLTTGDYIPIQLASKDTLIYYQLFELTPNAAKDISSTIRNTSLNEYKNYKLEGKSFPSFNFKDLNGRIFNNVNTKDKTIFLKCWFINCKPCVAEMPELNKLVDKYKGNNKVVFISLALDPAKDLKKFLAKTEFKYSVVPNQQKFLKDVLKVNAYPTHFIIKNGVIKKVVNSYDDLISVLGKFEKSPEPTKMPPPPPPPPAPLANTTN